MLKRKLFVLVSAILFVCLIFAISYPIIIDNLIVDENPVQSDVIIVPEGQKHVRAYKASELLHKDFSVSGKIIVSPLDETNVKSYKKFGVKEEQIIAETKATSTYENAVNTLKIMKEYEFDSAIIVSSDYHMLRIKLIYERLNQNYDFDLTYVAAYQLSDNEFVPWYEGGEYLQYSANREFWKYWGYLLRLYYFFNL